MRYNKNNEHSLKLRNWLRDKRTEGDFSLRELANRVDSSHPVLVRIENGDRSLDILEFVEYCDALDIDPMEGLEILVNSINSSKDHLIYPKKI